MTYMTKKETLAVFRKAGYKIFSSKASAIRWSVKAHGKARIALQEIARGKYIVKRV